MLEPRVLGIPEVLIFLPVVLEPRVLELESGPEADFSQFSSACQTCALLQVIDCIELRYEAFDMDFKAA